MIELFVNGKPRTAGSKSAFFNKKTGKIIVAPAGKYQKPWMEMVRWAAIEKGYNGKFILEGAIKLTIEFTFRRPKSHFKKNGELTKSAHPYHTTKPDLTKLTRAVEDALTGLIWIDDSQIIVQATLKRYMTNNAGEAEGCYVKIEEIK